jgi:hypothetical protein
MRDANIPLYIPGISLGWRVLVGEGGKIVNIIFNYKKITSNGNECFLMRAKVWVVLVEKIRFY